MLIFSPKKRWSSACIFCIFLKESVIQDVVALSHTFLMATFLLLISVIIIMPCLRATMLDHNKNNFDLPCDTY